MEIREMIEIVKKERDMEKIHVKNHKNNIILYNS